ncbi:hypothetical protein FOL46_006949 [Perkinsus olseni]|uniref:Uncharacterized protein n=1 Tax=Perkinsus olseni TaxID=32597 RepID=A0A7J6LGM9_PEROL|nr:hypothetical protein FOL46_006949 [Perkinsus olseni]
MGCGASLCRSSSAAAAAPPPPAEGPARGESKGPALAATDGCDNGLGTSIPPVSPSGGEEEMEDLVGTFYQRRVGDADGRAWRVVEALARGGEQSLDDLDPIDWNGMWRSVSSKVLKLVGGVEALKGEDVEAAAAGLFVTELANDTHYFPFELLFRESNKVDDAVRLMKKLSCLDEAFMNTIAIITTTEEFRSAGAAVAAGVYCRRVPADSEEHRRAKAEVKRAEDRFVCLVEMEPGVVVWSSALVGRGEEVKALRVHRTGGRRRQVLVFRNADTCHEACVFSGGQEVEWGWVDLAEEEQITLGVTRVEARARAESEVDFDICGFPYALRVSFPDGACPDRAVCLRARQALRRQIARGGSVMEVCKAALKDLDLTFAAVPFIVAEELRVCREETRALEVKFMHNRLVPWCVLMVARACKYTARRYGNALPGSGSRAEGRVSYSEALFCVLFNTAWDGKFSPSDDPAAIASTLYVTLAVLLSAVGKEAPPAALVLGLALLDPPELLRAMAWELRVVLPESTVEKTLFRRRGRRPGIFQAVEGAVLQPGSGHMIELQAMLRPSRVYTVKPRLSKGRGESSRAAVKVHESLGVHWLEEQVSGLPLRELLLACCLPSPLNLPNSRLAYYRMRLILQGAWSAARRSGSAGVLPCFPNLSRSVLAVRPSDPELLAGLWCTKGVAAGSSNSPELSSVLFLQALAMLVSKGGYGDPRARLGQGERIVAWLAWRLGKHAYVKGEVLKVEKYGDIFRGCGEAARDGMNFEPPRVESGPFLDRAETARDLTGGPLRDEEVDEVLASSMADVDVKRFPWAMDLSRPYPVAAFQRSPQGVGQIVREYKQVPAAPVVSDTQEVTRGTCFGFGSNDRDQLGVRSITEASSAVNWTARPVRLMCLKERRLVDVSAGDSISAAVCDEGRLYVWGSSFPEVSIPRFPQGVVVETVSCAASAVVALSEDGRLWQLGDLTSSPTSSRVGAAGAGVLEISLGGGASRAAAVSCGSYHAIAIDTRGRLWAWGRGEGGQLGIEDVEAYYDVKNETIVTTPTMLAGDISSISFASVSCGEAHSAAVTAAGQLYCWGWGEFGQLGLGFSADTFPPGQGGNSCRSPTPKVVEVGSDRDGVVTAVSCGGAFTACLTTLGDVWTWGSNESGQLALPPGDPMELTRPRKVSNVPPGKRFKNVSCGFAHVLAIDAQGQVHAWGSDCYGQLGLLNPPAKSSGSWIAKAPPPRTSRQSCEYVPSVVGSIGAVRMGACAAGYGHSLLLSDPGGEGSSYRARRSEAIDIGLYPVDTIKTRIQSRQGFWATGGFRGVYSGVGAAALGSAPAASLFFLTYEQSKSRLPLKEGSFLLHGCSAALAECVACAARVPSDILKQNRQAGQFGTYREVVSHIYRNFGVGGFFTGYLATLAREIPFGFIEFPIWEKLKAYLARMQGREQVTPFGGAICGAIAGGIAAAVTTPLDVVKTRSMLSIKATETGSAPFLKTMMDIVRTEGPRALTKGMLPRVIQVSSGGIIFFGIYGWASEMTKAMGFGVRSPFLAVMARGMAMGSRGAAGFQAWDNAKVFGIPLPRDGEHQDQRQGRQSGGKGKSSSGTDYGQHQFKEQRDAVLEMYPSHIITPDITTMPLEDPVKRPDLWMPRQDDEGDEYFPKASDVGRFLRLPRDELMELLPEGMGGELPRDIMLIKSRQRDLGIMLRKVTLEIMRQLQCLRDKPSFQHARGWLLDGKKGSGKSGVLNFIVCWARLNGWLVVYEPLLSRYNREIAEIKRSNAGLYIQNEFSQQFLERTSIRNREFFEQMPVDMSVYGRKALDGNDLNFTRRLYAPLIEKAVNREIVLKFGEDIDLEHLTAEQIEFKLERMAHYRRDVKIPSMTTPLPEPGTLWDIVDFALDNQAYACQAVYELFEQLKVQTKFPLLIVCDEWCEAFPVSHYVSMRYENTIYNGYIPAYHLTMSRLFSKWDGDEYKRGVKLYGTSWRFRNRRDYRPELCGVRDDEMKTVRNFSKHEFANYVGYYRLMNILFNFPRDKLEYFYMLSQGNGFQARRLLITLY